MTSTDVFGALASPVRRQILNLLLAGPQPVNDIAAHFDMRRPSVSEHLKVLRDAGLVSEQRDGRQRFYRLEASPLEDVRDWLTPYERFWRGSLHNLRNLLDSDTPDSDTPDTDTRDSDALDGDSDVVETDDAETNP
jgi:DNA-binding transcriptional ArsR family regulator